MGQISKAAYQSIKNQAESFIYSSEWNGSMDQVKIKAITIADNARKLDTNNNKHLYKIALSVLEKYAQDRIDFENECALMYEQHEMGCACDGREYSDYGINMYGDYSEVM